MKKVKCTTQAMNGNGEDYGESLKDDETRNVGQTNDGTAINITFGEDVFLRPDELSEIAKEMKNESFTLEEFIRHHIKTKKANEQLMDYYSRLYSIQNKRAQLLTEIYEDFFKHNRKVSFKYLRNIQELRYSFENIIAESPEKYRYITKKIDYTPEPNNRSEYVGHRPDNVEKQQTVFEDSCLNNGFNKVSLPQTNDHQVSLKDFQASKNMDSSSIHLYCPGCGFGCHSTSQLDDHINDKHFENPLVICNHDDCDITFYIKNIKDHEEDYHRASDNALMNDNSSSLVDSKPKKIVRCPVLLPCAKPFEDVRLFRSHLLSQHGIKPSTLAKRDVVLLENKTVNDHRAEERCDEVFHDNVQNYDHNYVENRVQHESNVEQCGSFFSNNQISFDENVSGFPTILAPNVQGSVDMNHNPLQEVSINNMRVQATQTVQTITNTPDASISQLDTCNYSFEAYNDNSGQLDINTELIRYELQQQQLQTVTTMIYRCEQCSFFTQFHDLYVRHKLSSHGQYRNEPQNAIIEQGNQVMGSHENHQGLNLDLNLNHFHQQHQQPPQMQQIMFRCDYPNCQYISPYQKVVTIHKLTHSNPKYVLCRYDNRPTSIKRDCDPIHPMHADSHYPQTVQQPESNSSKRTKIVESPTHLNTAWSTTDDPSQNGTAIIDSLPESHEESIILEIKDLEVFK